MASEEEDLDCPLCMEEFDIADCKFRPCPCGYQICRFCWHHIKTNLNGRCPACRRAYTDQIVEFVPVSTEEILRSRKEKKEKERQQRDMKDPNRRQLSGMRVVQKNLVYVLGLGSKHAQLENEFFKKYGKITKLVVSKRSVSSTQQPSSSQVSVGIYVTYARKEDAAKAVAGINGSTFDGKAVRASFGTTKYCTYYLRHMNCSNPSCMYLHEPGDDVDSYNKENPTLVG
ncbi:RING/Ubox like zinc-binding domain-containing protein [Spinellus fusiger]|nr:RING/Ubox like zinc-binding domain-containing protein [Spinellus fusiger]